MGVVVLGDVGVVVLGDVGVVNPRRCGCGQC